MQLEIEQKILDNFNSSDLKVFFYNAGCEGTIINITNNFKKLKLEKIEINGKTIYYEIKDKINLDGGKILSGKEGKYFFISPKIKSRCNCSSSFSFENKIIDKEKLNKLKLAFKK